MLSVAPARVTINRNTCVENNKEMIEPLLVNCLHFFIHRFAISLSIDWSNVEMYGVDKSGER